MMFAKHRLLLEGPPACTLGRRMGATLCKRGQEQQGTFPASVRRRFTDGPRAFEQMLEMKRYELPAIDLPPATPPKFAKPRYVPLDSAFHRGPPAPAPDLSRSLAIVPAAAGRIHEGNARSKVAGWRCGRHDRREHLSAGS